MRIITGAARGCKLKAPKGLNTRPTTDRVKEAIFNILGARTREAKILDIFAGTGALGLEALSRGGSHAMFIDLSGESIRVIKDNAAHTKLDGRSEIVRADVFLLLERLKRRGEKFTLVFCDPPYNKGLAQRVLEIFSDGSLLEDLGVLVIEHDKNDALPTEFAGALFHARSEKYGATMVSFYQQSGEEDKKAEEDE
jgi:16S rRNA (guanine(966)-N(2))-methyltransferase RsmD